MLPNSLQSLTNYAKTLVQNRPTPAIGITAGIMAIVMLTPAETAKNLNPVMTRASPKPIPKGDPIKIIPNGNGWEPSIRKMLQTKHHPSP